MKKAGFALALAAMLAMPGAAMAKPTKQDTRSASAECHAIVEAAVSKANVESFSNGEYKNFGQCVSFKAHEEAQERKASRLAARESCKGLKGDERRGCVRSEKAEVKAQKDAKDQARIEAAETCTAEQEDVEAFAAAYGTKKNAYRKCVRANTD